MSEAQEIKFGIITPTYWKLDGSTRAHLTDTLNSIASQTYKDYKLFLIGDDYKEYDELLELSKIVNNVYVENLPVAVERIKYNGRDLWACGGGNASNVGVGRAVSEGYNYICQVDHDDVIFSDHLETIAKCIHETGANFVTTKCGSYPPIEGNVLYTSYRPQAGKLFQVSTCYNQLHYNVKRRSPEERKRIYGSIYAGDADLWQQIHGIMEDSGEWGVFINQRTCRKIGGKVPINNPEIVK
jgi:glycosyltransferase involved in cell wall biosynthesis